MSNLHIYVERHQPATRYYDYHSGKRLTFTHPARALCWVGCCKRRRFAENCIVQVYYDHTVYWCAPGKGCKRKRK